MGSRHRLKIFVKDLILFLTGALLSPAEKSIPIITYHSVDRSGSIISKDPSDFEREMQYLADHKYQTINFSTFLNIMRDEKLDMPEKAVILTFDDGYSNTFDVAYPILKRHKFIANIFLSTAYIDGKNVWESNKSVPSMDILSRSQIQALYEDGFSFLPHSHNHRDLTELDPEEIKNELSQCEETLRELSLEFEKVFCYPYGLYDQKVVKILKDLKYEAAVTLDHGVVKRDNTDMLLLKRIGSAKFHSPMGMRAALNGRLDNYLSLKRSIKRKKSSKSGQ